MLISEIIRYYLLRVSKLILIVSNYDKILLKFESLYQYIFTYHINPFHPRFLFKNLLRNATNKSNSYMRTYREVYGSKRDLISYIHFVNTY